MTLVIEPTKTSAGTRKLPIAEDVAKCFQVMIKEREKLKIEKSGGWIHRVPSFE